MRAVKFNTQDQPEFYRTLRKRVDAYFRDNQISRYANGQMKFKTVFMLSLYLIPFILLLTGVITGFGPSLIVWVLMGLGMSGIGLSIMHDANHGAYSNNQRINRALGYTMNLIGGYHINWKIQHNVLHHSFTNIHGHDEDINKDILRLTPDTKHKPIHRLQVIYAPLLYSIMTIYWLVSKDLAQINRYSKEGLLKQQGLSYGRALTEVLILKIAYVAFTLVLPMLVTSLLWWQVLIGFLLMHFLCGLILALIFQPAHVQESATFYEVSNAGSVENHWAIHQLRTTANFANRSRFFSWFVGGLNYQVEHHLFPNICHIHYRKLSPIVKKTAQEFNVPYYEFTTFYDAVKSHFSLLWNLGMNRYQQNVY